MENNKPFYLSIAENASFKDLSQEKIDWFLERAKTQRDFKFNSNKPLDIVKELALIEGGKLLYAALMLFSKDLQKYCPTFIIKCSYYYGVEVTRPIPSQKNFSGDLFMQVDSAVDFVLSKLNTVVGERSNGGKAEITEEVPNEVISEIIVNAIVHRDYSSNGSVQVSVFSDRIEIINPGKLPNNLSLSDLNKSHLSIPVNPFLARPFYLAGYINQLGYGTLNVYKWCKEANLPEPLFKQENNHFSVTIFRNWLTEDIINKFDLNERQKKVVNYLKNNKNITNSKYQKICEVAKRTATKDLNHLTSIGLLIKIGTTGKGVYYEIIKGAPKGHKGH